MNFIGWIRDLFGIQKDMYETKKTRLDIEKLEDEKREKLITPATLDDVKKYDPRMAAIIREIEDREGGSLGGNKYLKATWFYVYRYKRKTFWLLVILPILVALLVWLTYR